MMVMVHVHHYLSFCNYCTYHLLYRRKVQLAVDEVRHGRLRVTCDRVENSCVAHHTSPVCQQSKKKEGRERANDTNLLDSYFGATVEAETIGLVELDCGGDTLMLHAAARKLCFLAVLSAARGKRMLRELKLARRSALR
jgi:hypothetical protein